jgi:hypothetical protein
VSGVVVMVDLRRAREISGIPLVKYRHLPFLI